MKIAQGTLATLLLALSAVCGGAEMKRNGVLLGPGPAADAQVAEMQKRLADPQLRQQLVVETRAQMASSHPDLAEVVGLDEREAAAFFDLLTDQQMKHLDLFYSEVVTAGQQTSHTEFEARTRKFADDETRKMQEIKAQLGEERFDRYLDYQQTRFERMQVARFDERLAPADKLTADQKQQLMKIVRTEFDRSMEQRRGMMRLVPPSGTYTDLQTAMQKNMFAEMENNYRQMREDSRTLLAKLPEVLTPNQVAEYAKMEDEKLAAQKKYNAERRAEAGLPAAEVDDGPPPAPLPGRVPVAGQVRVDVYFRTNDAEPVKVAFTTENGKPAPMFDAHDGLWVEVTPRLFEDGWASVDYQCYEDRNGQRRKVGGKGATGSQMSSRPAGYAVGLGGGGGGTIFGGSKAYSIRIDVRVTPVP